MTYDIVNACKAQYKYCEDHNVPHFAPSNGICWSCGQNIYSEKGFSVEYAGKRLITGCPFCRRSYCD